MRNLVALLEEQALATLGLERGASPREIKWACLDLVQICHPDKVRGQSERVRTKAEKQFKEVGRAYEFLKSCWGGTLEFNEAADP